jgi:hypothetical protein
VAYFLIVYDKPKGDLLLLRRFEDGREALKHRFGLEKQHVGETNLEIVVLGAGTLADLERTHRRYFRSVREMATEAAEMLEQNVQAERPAQRSWHVPVVVPS